MITPNRPSINLRTGEPLTPTQLKFMPSKDLQRSLGEFLNLETRDLIAYNKATIPLYTTQKVGLDLGNGSDITGLDTAANRSYTAHIGNATGLRIPLKNTVMKVDQEHEDSIKLRFHLLFTGDMGRKLLVGKPLFPDATTDPGDLYVRLPRTRLVGASAIDSAFDTLQTKMNSIEDSMSAPSNMYVTGASVYHRWATRTNSVDQVG